MALDSDVNNADSQLIVEFYDYDRDPYKDRTFIRIIVPGNDKLVVDTLAQEFHKRRFPHAWLRFQMKNAGETVQGTTLEAWCAENPQDINPDQVAELRIFKFQSVEQVAHMSDQVSQKIGMGGIALREKANAYLRNKNKAVYQNELAATKNELQALRDQVALLMSAKAEKPTDEAVIPFVAAVVRTPAKRGPKPGWKKQVNEQHAASVGATGSK